jgi:hypothetical protein
MGANGHVLREEDIEVALTHWPTGNHNMKGRVPVFCIHRHAQTGSIAYFKHLSMCGHDNY